MEVWWDEAQKDFTFKINLFYCFYGDINKLNNTDLAFVKAVLGLAETSPENLQRELRGRVKEKYDERLQKDGGVDYQKSANGKDVTHPESETQYDDLDPKEDKNQHDSGFCMSEDERKMTFQSSRISATGNPLRHPASYTYSNSFTYNECNDLDSKEDKNQHNSDDLDSKEDKNQHNSGMTAIGNPLRYPASFTHDDLDPKEDKNQDNSGSCMSDSEQKIRLPPPIPQRLSLNLVKPKKEVGEWTL